MTPKEYEIMLADAEVQLSRLKHLYEQWFQGIERTEPLIPRKQLDRARARLQGGLGLVQPTVAGGRAGWVWGWHWDKCAGGRWWWR